MQTGAQLSGKTETCRRRHQGSRGHLKTVVVAIPGKLWSQMTACAATESDRLHVQIPEKGLLVVSLRRPARKQWKTLLARAVLGTWQCLLEEAHVLHCELPPTSLVQCLRMQTGAQLSGKTETLRRRHQGSRGHLKTVVVAIPGKPWSQMTGMRRS